MNGNGAIRFRTVIEKKTENCEIVNVAYGRADNVGELRDDAKVIIEGCEVEVL